MIVQLPYPTDQLVKAEAEQFDKENRLDEEALGRLLKLFPENTNLSEVRLKVAGFNELYRAGLQSKHIEKIARHIASTANFDALLQQGSPDAAVCIIDCKDVRHYFSF